MTVARLDYSPEALAPFGRDKILMEANTDIEKSMRLNACDKEPWTVALIESLRQGESFWDIGANVGAYSLLAAIRGAQVVAFEPVAENYATLCRNLALNGIESSVVTLPFALGDQDAMIWQHRSDLRSGAASHVLSASGTKQGFHQTLIPILTASTAQMLFGLLPPNVIKIDVDGFELQVLQGLEAVLANSTVRAIMLEVHRAQEEALGAWLEGHGWGVAEQYPQRGDVHYALCQPVAVGVRAGPVAVG